MKHTKSLSSQLASSPKLLADDVKASSCRWSCIRDQIGRLEAGRLRHVLFWGRWVLLITILIPIADPLTGAASEGDFHAALGMNSVLGGPCVWFCRNNG